jgi:hypothetical protein
MIILVTSASGLRNVLKASFALSNLKRWVISFFASIIPHLISSLFSVSATFLNIESYPCSQPWTPFGHLKKRPAQCRTPTAFSSSPEKRLELLHLQPQQYVSGFLQAPKTAPHPLETAEMDEGLTGNRAKVGAENKIQDLSPPRPMLVYSRFLSLLQRWQVVRLLPCRSFSL